MNILAVESSCDETAVAIVRDGREVLTDCIASQVALHREYGGVVPEIASRKHIEAIYGLADQALEEAGMTREDIDAVAVTYAPGLIGSVLVGVNFAKAAAMAMGKPLIVSGYGGLPELVEDGVNGYIYEKTAENLADCIRKQQHLTEEEYQAMSRASLERAKALFSPDAYVEQIENWYQKMKETDNGR